MSFTRVIPRDLFNEAKLLKCIGQLVLHVHEGQVSGLSFEHDGDPFQIEQCEADGSLYVTNVRFAGDNGQEVNVGTVYNSKEPYPLYTAEDGIPVFTDDGKPHPVFVEWLAGK